MIISQFFGRTRGAAFWAALLVIALVGCSNNAKNSDGTKPEVIMGSTPAQVGVQRASFTADNQAQLPVGYRQWLHVGTRDNAKGKISIIDGQPTQTPEVLNAYVEPGAFVEYMKTGKWPDGSVMVKEFSAVRVGAGCQADTYLCTTEFGEGIFETGYVGLGMMVKDAKRFPDAPGHWGFFEFGHHAPPYEPVSAVRPAGQCSNCHVRLASDTDFVISRAHIGLTRTNTP